MITKKKKWLLMGLMCLVLWPGAIHGQSPEIESAHNRFSELLAQGRYKEVPPFAEKALRLVEEDFGPDHPTTADLLYAMALEYHQYGRYGEAEPLYERVLAISEKASARDYRYPDVTETLLWLARVYHAQGKYTEAEPLYKRSLAIREKAGHPDVAANLDDLALLYYAQGRFAEAAKMKARAIAIRAKNTEANPVQ